MGTGGPFPGAKRGRGMTLTTHPQVVLRSIIGRSYTSSPPSATTACSGTALLFLNPSPRPGFEPATPGTSGKHTTHYTTVATASTHTPSFCVCVTSYKELIKS
jgi:hypothetical protein